MQLLTQGGSPLFCWTKFWVLGIWYRSFHDSPATYFSGLISCCSLPSPRLPYAVHLALWPDQTTGYSLNVSHIFTPLGLCKCYFLFEIPTYPPPQEPAQTSFFYETFPELPPADRIHYHPPHAPATSYILLLCNFTMWHLSYLLTYMSLHCTYMLTYMSLYCKLWGNNWVRSTPGSPEGYQCLTGETLREHKSRISQKFGIQ